MNIINIEHIAKVYQVGSEEVFALRDVSLRIDKNEYVAIMGPSGSGKSTLMNILGCLDTPTSGKYDFNSISVSQMNDNQLAKIRNKEIGFVFQTFNLLARSDAVHNVELPLIYAGIASHERKERAKQALIDVGLSDRMHHKPNELSGGQRQRVACARALVTRPSIILADEPTGNLDPETSEALLKVFMEINKEGKTIVMATHDYPIIQKFPARKIICEEDGIRELADDTEIIDFETLLEDLPLM